MSAIPATSPQVESRLPNVGTTIFTVMSALATEHGAVNLGQGFPDFDCDPRLVAAVADATQRGLNQYPPMAGVPALREAKELHARKAELLHDGGPAEEVRAIWQRLSQLEEQARAQFPLSDAECAELRARLQERIMMLYEGEVAAHAEIPAAIG